MRTATKKKPTKKTKAKKPKSKKPKWTLVTFKQIEQWRVKLGLSKSSMAEALGVTNSTFHNWQRGTTVPHPNQQEEIATRLAALETNPSSGSGTSAIPGGKARVGAKKKAKTKRGASKAARSSGTKPTARRATSEKGVASSVTHLGSPKVPRDDIAAITVAFIQSQKKSVSADSIVNLVSQLAAAI